MAHSPQSAWHDAQSPERRLPGAPKIGRPLLFVGGVALMILLTTLEGAILRTYRGQPVEWESLVQGRVLAWTTCAIFLPLLYMLAKRLPVEKESWRAALPLHLAASLLAAAGKYALYLPLANAFGDQSTRPWTEIVRANFLGELMFYWAMIGFAPRCCVPRPSPGLRRIVRSRGDPTGVGWVANDAASERRRP